MAFVQRDRVYGLIVFGVNVCTVGQEIENAFGVVGAYCSSMGLLVGLCRMGGCDGRVHEWSVGSSIFVDVFGLKFFVFFF